MEIVFCWLSFSGSKENTSRVFWMEAETSRSVVQLVFEVETKLRERTDVNENVKRMEKRNPLSAMGAGRTSDRV